MIYFTYSYRYKMNALITILGIAPFSLLIINLLKYIFLPHYRFQISQQKLKEKTESVMIFYHNTYKSYKNGEQIPPYELQMKTDIAFGKKNFYYKIIFLLFDRDVVYIENKAKDLIGVQFLLNIDYQQSKITPPQWLSKKSLIWIFIIAMIIYTIISILLVFSISHVGSMFIKSIWPMTTLFLLLVIDVLVIITVGRLKSIKDLIDW